MTKCKICEQNIIDDKLLAHSDKCKEVMELQIELSVLRSKMQAYDERATLMKNSLENNAARQRRLHQKRPSRGTPGTDLNSPGLRTSTKDSFSAFLAAKHNESGEDLDISGDDIGTPSMTARTFSRESGEPIKKMPLEEYNKFIEEVKKSVFALKKVSGFAAKVVERCLQLGQRDDPDRIAQNEMEIIYEQIVDSKVSEFINDFKQDLTSYVEKKAKFMTGHNKLVQIGGYDKVIENVKEKFKATKSSSYRKNGINFNKLGITPNKFKEDDGLAKEHSKSPGTSKKKTLPTNKGIPEFVTPLMGPKKTLNRQIGASGPLQSPLLSALGGFPTKINLATPKTTTQKMDLSKAFLQTNTNHMSMSSSFKKNAEDLNQASRDKLKSIAVYKIDLTEKSDKKSPQFSASVASSPRATSPKTMINSFVNSPGLSSLLSPHMNKLKEYKEKNLSRKSRFSTNPIKEEKVESSKPATPTQAQSKAKQRSISMDLLKALHKEEVKQFPTLLTGGVTTSAANQPLQFASNNNSPKNFFNETSKHGKSKKKNTFSDALEPWESPSMKGYHSDVPLKKTKILQDGEDVQKTTIKDFKFLKFLGKGAYGTVWLVERIATGDLYAMKIVETASSYTQNRKQALKQEKEIYQALQGDFVVKAIWTFKHEDYICFVTEYMYGGDFNKIIEKMGRLDNEQAQFYFAELILAVESLHNLQIVHRDLKPDNILLDRNGHIRLTDFGLSEKGLDILRGNNTPLSKKNSIGSPGQSTSPSFLEQLKEVKQKEDKLGLKVRATKKKDETIFNFLEPFDQKKALMRKPSIAKEVSPVMEKKVRIIGTPDYMAPEIICPERLNGQTYDDKCLDFWSLGVILYEFFVGIPPFNDDTREDIFENIKNLKIVWPGIGYDEDEITPEAENLIKKLLNPDPTKRLGAKGIQEIKDHPYFKGFDWEGLREREAPIIPCLLEDSMDTEESAKTREDETIKLPFNPLDGKKSAKKADKDEEVDFMMSRVDVLHKMNKEAAKKLEKQKSVISKLV